MLGLGTAIPFNQNVGNLVAPLNPLQMSVNCGLWYDFTDLSVQTIDPSTSGISEITNKGLILGATLQQRKATSQPISVFSEGQNSARFLIGTQMQLLSTNTFSLEVNGVFVIVAKLIDEATQSVYGMATMRVPNVVSMRFINNGGNTRIQQFTSGTTSTDDQATSPTATNINGSMYNISSTDQKLTAFNNNNAGASSDMLDTPVTTAGGFIIGSSNLTDQYFNGEIFEVIYFQSDLTDQLRGEILAYTETKYAIPQA